MVMGTSSQSSKSKQRVCINFVLEDDSDLESDGVEVSLADPFPPYTLFLHSNGARSPGQKYDAYCVWNGRTVGIFTGWYDVQNSTKDVFGAHWLGFNSLESAIEGWKKKVIRNPDVAQRAREQIKHQTYHVPSLTTMFSSLSPPSSPMRPHAGPSQHLSSPLPASASRSAPCTSDEGHFYVVLRGTKPGVYQGSLTSWNAAGPHTRAKRVKKDSEADAWKYFGQMVMLGKTEQL